MIKVATPSRNNNLDMLRIIATLMVVLIHVTAPIVTRQILSNQEPITFIGVLNLLFSTFSSVAVPVFVMLSGHLNLTTYESNDYGGGIVV